MTARGRRSLIMVGSLAWLAGMVAMVAAEHGGFVDLAVYRFGGLSVLDDLPLYELGEAGTGLPFTYPPFAALLMTGPALLPFPLAVGLWTSISVLALAVTITLVLPSHGRPRSSYVVPGLVLGALAFEPIWSNLLFGQVNLLLMAAILVDLLGPGHRWSGALIGLVAGIKLTPLLFVVFLVLVGRRHQAAIAGLTFLVTVALGFALLPLASSAYWSHVLWDPGRVGGVPYASNQSVLGGLTRLAGGEPSTAVWFLVAGAIAGPILLLAARTWRRGDPALGTCVAAIAMLLASPISWSHHWAWAVPTAIVLARSGRRWAAASWSLVFVSACIWWPPHRDDLELAWSPLQQVVGNAYLWAALALVLLLVRTPASARTGASELVGVER